MKKKIAIAMMIAALTLPGLALACTVVQVDGNADCEGWEACFTINWTDPTLETTLEWAVVLVGDDLTPLEGYGEQTVVTREEGVYTTQFCAQGLWQGYHDNPPFQVAIAGNIIDTEAIGITIDLDCVVDDEDYTWDELKSYYR